MLIELLSSGRRDRLTAYINATLKAAEERHPDEEHCIVADLASYTIGDITKVTEKYKKDYTVKLVRIHSPFNAIEIYMKEK